MQSKSLHLYSKCLLILLILFSPIIIAAGGNTLKEEINTGINAYNRGDYEAAKKIWTKAANANSASAQYNLGQMYRMGQGVTIDYQQAKTWYMAAAKQGHPQAQGNLGTLYYHGKLGEPDYSEAYKWLLPAAQQHNTQAQRMIGAMLYNGDGVKKDIVQSFAWLTLASEKNQQAMANKNQLEQELTALQKQDAQRLVDKLRSTRKTDELKTPARETTTPTSKAPLQYRVQLGAYRLEETAKETFLKLQNRMPDLLGELKLKIELTSPDSPESTLFRLQAGGFSERRDAKTLCEQLKKKGSNCVVVKT